MAILKRTRQAEIDLLDIWAFISQDNLTAADKIVRQLDARSHELLGHPEMGIARDDVAKGMRHLVMGSYLILYRIDGEDIEVVRYLHGARNLFSI